MQPAPRTVLVVVGVGLALALVGGGLAGWGYTAGGDVTTHDVSFGTEHGHTVAGTLYVPPEASSDDPAPGVILYHGHAHTRADMTPLASELADRGYVVLTVDQPGHGTSDPPIGADDWGGPAAFTYFTGLTVVDDDRIGLVGHSTGGYAALQTARYNRRQYESLVLLGATSGMAGAPGTNAYFPQNLLVVYGAGNEYSQLMWGEPVATDIGRSEKILQAFDSDDPVEPDGVYGAVGDHDARKLTHPSAIHATEPYCSACIAEVLDWMALTLREGEATVPPDDQTWRLAELGAAAGFLGGLLVFVGSVPLAARRFEVTPTAPAVRADGAGSGIAATTRERHVTATAIAIAPVVTYYSMVVIGSELLPPTRVFPQRETTALVLWGLASVLLAGGLVVLHRELWADGAGARPVADLRARLDRGVVLGSLAAALVAAGVLYLVVAIITGPLDGLLRWWLVSLERLTVRRTLAAVAYVPFVFAVTLALAVGLHRVLAASADRSLPAVLARNLAVTTGGMLLLLAVQYGPLLFGGGLPVPALAGGTVLALSGVSVLAVATVVSTVLYRLSGRVVVTATAVAVLVTWLLVGTMPLYA